MFISELFGFQFCNFPTIFSLQIIAWYQIDNRRSLKNTKNALTASTEEKGRHHPDIFAEKWDELHPVVNKPRITNRYRLSIFYDCPEAINKIIYSWFSPWKSDS
jgi:transposase-like protein